MKKGEKEPPVPEERVETIRQEIIAVIRGRNLSSREISGYVGIPEREVYEHLKHIARTLSRKDEELIITHPVCRKCGFAFKKRERLKKPSRCPLCHSESIKEPLFLIRGSGK